MLFVEAAQKKPSTTPAAPQAESREPESLGAEQRAAVQTDADGKKKFVKSYGS
jgi:hypothetical protein